MVQKGKYMRVGARKGFLNRIQENSHWLTVTLMRFISVQYSVLSVKALYPLGLLLFPNFNFFFGSSSFVSL
jgi:hypothetical protein